MGKYMRKAKITGEVSAVMELVSSQSSIGVRTRAKTHALQRLQSSTTNPPPPSPQNPEPAYLQLRNRRLEKLQPSQPAHRNGSRLNPNPKIKPIDSGLVESVSIRRSKKNEEGVVSEFTKWACNEIEAEDQNDLGFEASFGENNVDFEGRQRSTRESTPCSLIRQSDTTETPGSTTRRTASTATNRRIQNAIQRNIPTTQEIEEFFSLAEQQQQRLFIEKYNFDVVNDLPLSGRYEWVSVNY